jgi:hypothetical protein
MPRFVVALRAFSAVRLEQNDEFRGQMTTPFGLATVVARTAYEPYGAGVVPRWLWIEVVLEAPSLGKARTVAMNTAEHLGSVLSVTMNAAIEHFVPTVAFDITEGAAQHPYWQLHLSQTVGLPRLARILNGRNAVRVLTAYEGHRWRAAIDRSLASYREALIDLVPGRLLMSAAHAWMGLEALKRAAVELELDARHLTRAQLAASWGVTTNVLDNEGRKRLLFPGRGRLHERCKTFSNDFEHAETAIDPLQVTAQSDASALVRLLRRQLIRLMFHPNRVPRALVVRAIATSFPSVELQRQLHGVLVGKVEDLAPQDLQYPNVDIATTPVGVTYLPNSMYTLQANSIYVPRLGHGVAMRDFREEIWRAPGTEV